MKKIVTGLILTAGLISGSILVGGGFTVGKKLVDAWDENRIECKKWKKLAKLAKYTKEKIKETLTEEELEEIES